MYEFNLSVILCFNFYTPFLDSLKKAEPSSSDSNEGKIVFTVYCELYFNEQ